MFSRFDDIEVEDYFNRLNAQLKRMPSEDRHEMHRELRQHLDALVAAHEELGATRWEAAQAAIEQMGDPAKVGRRLFQEWRLLRDKMKRPSALEAFGASGLLLALYIGALYLPTSATVPEWAAGPLRLYLCPPIVAGCLMGLFRPSTAVHNVIKACLLCCGIGMAGALPALGWDLAHVGITIAYGIQNAPPGVDWIGRMNDDAGSTVRGILPVMFGLLPGGVSAWLMSSLRRGDFSLPHIFSE